MPRVIAGSVRNHNLKAPEGLNTRPTTDRIKETLFNILQGDVPGAVVADFFAGSGQIGIESLSRGAEKAYFIDNSREAHEIIKDNLNHTKLTDKATVLCEDFTTAVYHINEKHVDIVFADPPYDRGFERQLLSVLHDRPYIDEDTIIIIEADIKTDFDYIPDLGYDILRVKEYKTNKHVFVSKACN
ncbi:MAG: 16S rRNA (guanine(966)-N(2))-methyltransferase RsmD [Clostridia bacterium]|nr:16S rRNA (guanine(966)-N(2))-methyltransferase RsmD [Clostridia bacterium]